ncbi:MAG: hypothetical protein LWW75_10480 [Chlorobiales bacterium]|nr:hypothetical protein [Chlorobiales bacterium]
MNVTHILIDDSNPLHRELPIYRTGQVATVRLSDSDYHVYVSLDIDAHDMAALFHYGVVEALNSLHFISETDKGLDSWDEAFLPSGQIGAMIGIIDECIGEISGKEPEKILLGWHDIPEESGLDETDAPQGVAYWRIIDPMKMAGFLGRLRNMAVSASDEGYDLEFIL